MQIVRGHLQAYDWGPVDGLTDWTASTGGPQAELWFGTHPNGPSPLLAGGVAEGSLPILMKLLAAARPLSIQIHPPAAMAAARYAAQQTHPGLPQLVSDPFGKAEMLIALAPFAILEGFRDPQVSAVALGQLGPQIQPMVKALAQDDLPAAIRLAFDLPTEVVRQEAPALPAAFEDAETADILTQVLTTYPADPGVFVAALLNARTLQPGEAVYVDPGTVHAYVRGLGLEVMTSSDNVLRLGLTSKTVAVDEALGALDVAAQPHACPAEHSAGVDRYAPAGAPFTVDLLERTSTSAAGGRARIVLCLSGSTTVSGLTLQPGEAALLAADDAEVTISVQGTAVMARHGNAAAGAQG